MMKQRILEQIASMPGHNGMYFKNLITGEKIEYRSDESFGPASVIKLPILMHICQLARQCQVRMDEKIRCRHADKLGGCGALRAFNDEPEVSISTLCELMITISDNSATNLLIHRFGMDALNESFRQMGLSVTRLNRILFDNEAASRGIENEFSPAEMGDLLEQIYRRKFVDETTSIYIEDMLMKQQINHKIPGIIGDAAPIAHKTGEDEGISNDVALVYAPEPFVLCYAGNGTNVPEFENFIRKTASELFLSCGGKL